MTIVPKLKVLIYFFFIYDIVAFWRNIHFYLFSPFYTQKYIRRSSAYFVIGMFF